MVAVLDPSALTGLKRGWFGFSAEDDRHYLVTPDGAVPVDLARELTTLDDDQIVGCGSDHFRMVDGDLNISAPAEPASVGTNAFGGLVNGIYFPGAVCVGLAGGTRRVQVEEEEPAVTLPSNWRGAVTFDPDVQDEYDTFAGAPADFLWGDTGHSSWAAFVNDYAEMLMEFPGETRPWVWSIPLTVDGTSLASVAGGSNDAQFTEVAEGLLAAAPDDNSAIIIRLGWEANFTGLWAWTAVGVEADYIAAWRRVHGLFRAVSPRFKFDWNLNYVQHDDNYEPETFYPGDAYVDVVSMDLYYRKFLDGDDLPTNPDPVGNFNYVKALPRGLDWIIDFANTHGKPMSVPEWGCEWEKPQWVELAASWIESLPDLVYQTYFDNNIDPTHPMRISDGSKGLAGHAYLMHFGEDVPVYGAADVAGAAVGVIGSGGALPTTWGASGGSPWGNGTFTNTTIEVLQVTEDAKIACIDIKITGTADNGLAQFYGGTDWGGISPAQNDVWRMAFLSKVLGQTGGGINPDELKPEIYEVSSGYGGLGNSGESGDPYDYSTLPFYAQHYTHYRKLASADVAMLVGSISAYLTALPSSVTLRIAAPVLTKDL